MKKEFLIIVSILFILTITVHYKEFLEYPFEQITALATSGAYGLGALHPIIFSLIIYLLLWVPRLVIKLFRKKSQ
ncbi:MAG: hypothetical protein CL624_04935 [Arcobacter sp.]|jgi:hypothetical protein|uniref:hypothetical protein n=1 Tax=Poseidonibacter ostreae TaxID=2654171 RepID=UPI000C8C8059|nr:hypothetical protein [Poseidonibacter ostreae]KAB7886553.1 hypothetical protein GA417_05290 [Poseidonibacter ostreae]MAC83460.1 hypothetical protein [Arcobacter sp.]|tara:strand:- start:1362 stop:1586 length:225 start_codon:yes stop_codon:yes gene_type:complete